MKIHLQKSLLGFCFGILFIGLFAIDIQAQELNTVWERTDRTGAAEAKPSWFTIGSVRGMASGVVNGNARVYAADRANNTIQVMDAATGADITPATAFDLSGVTGGTLHMNDIEVSDDGVIFLGNLASDTSPFRLYWWSTEGGAYADSVTIPVAGRTGDKFTVVGSLADNTIEVWLPVASVDPGIVYVATTADQGATWSVETITLSGTNTVVGSSVDATPLALGRTSDFYVGGNSSAPARYSSTGEFVTGSALASTSRNGMEAFSYDGKDHLAVYTYRPDPAGSGNKTGMVYVYDVSDATNPTIAAETPLMGDDADTYSSIHGEAEVMLNVDGTYNVFALEGVNGFAAYTNAIPPYFDAPSNLFFSEYIEGSSNNKALEIMNNTDSTVVLANYQIAQTNNGSDWINFHAFAEGATIAPGDVYVIITDQLDPTLFPAEEADEVLGYDNVNYNNPVHFNGDDARAIIHIDATTGDTTMIDVIGESNLDPGKAWDVAGVTNGTQNYTLVRKASVTTGNTTPLGSFGTNYDDSEWMVKSQNIFSNLGMPSVEMEATLAGDYYIPQRSTDDDGFISLHQAFHYVNTLGLSGSTDLLITDDLYEDSELKIDRPDLTESTDLTIKPASGVTPTIDVMGGSGGDGIWINSTDHVTIDGSNTLGGETRDLTITSSDSTFAALIYTYGTNHTIIANSVLTYTGTDNSVSGIVTNESGPKGTENLLVYNNLIGSENGDFENGVGLWGTSSVQAMNSSVIENRIYATYRGVTTWWSHGNDIIDNVISIDSPKADRSRYAGIYLALNGGQTNVIGNEIVGVQINRTSTSRYGAGILFNASLDTVVVANNMIAINNFDNVGAATDNEVYGIGFDNAAGNSYNAIYHNTVQIGGSDEIGVHAAFGAIRKSSTAQFWDLKNNIFVVDQDAENAHAIYWPINGVTNLNADFNNYNADGTSANLGYYNEAAAADLAEWQTASMHDANTTDVSVEFVSTTDLRLTGASNGDENLAGTPLAFFDEDIDGNSRSLSAPYKGAFEGDIELTAAEITIDDFGLLTPTDSSSVDLGSDLGAELTFSWEEATSNGVVTYMLLLDSLDGDFNEPLLGFDSDEDGEETMSVPTYADVDSVLADLGVLEGEEITLRWTVVAFAGDTSKMSTDVNIITFKRQIIVSNEEEALPVSFSLEQNYPNPFNPSSTIQFSLPEASEVRLDVFTITGQHVSTLVNNRLNSGEHSVTFDGSNLASGVYIYRIVAGKFMKTKRMTLIK